MCWKYPPKPQKDVQAKLKELSEKAQKAIEVAFSKPPRPEVVERVRRAKLMTHKDRGLVLD